MVAWAVAAGVAGILITILWIKLSVKRTRLQKQFFSENVYHIDSFEHVLRIAHDVNGLLIVARAVVLSSKKPIKASVVKNAMILLTKRHPMLRMCIRKDQDGVFCFQEMDKVDFRQLGTRDWRNVMEESLLEKFDAENGPLWRLIFLANARYKPGTEIRDTTSYPNECICIFGFHHLIIDGPSLTRMFAEFINYVERLTNNEEPEVLSMSLLPSCHVYLHEAVGSKWYHCLMTAALNIFSSLPCFPVFMMGVVFGMSRKGNVFTKKYGIEVQRNPEIQPRTKIIPLEFSKKDTSSLLQKCKEHQTTVQGAIQAAGGFAMATLLDENEFEIECAITVNARPFFKSRVPNEYARPYLGFISCKNSFIRSPDIVKFWCMAKSISNDIHAKLKKNEHMKSALMFDYMAPMLSRLFKSTNKDDEHGGRSNNLIVYNNLGSCKFLHGSPDDDVIIRASFGCTAEHQQGSIFANSIITFNDQLFWTVVYYSNITSETMAQRYAGLIKETILKAI